MKKWYFIALSALMLITTACSTDDNLSDTTPPVLEWSLPFDESHLSPGDELPIQFTVSDQVGLAAVKISIHYGGGHHHRFTNEHFEWQYEQIITIEGNHYAYDNTLIIPSYLNDQPIKQGDYHMGIHVLDTSGNETTSWRMLEIHEH